MENPLLNHLIIRCISFITKIALRLRYRITFKGLEHLKRSHLQKKGGVLFLPNHPAQIDPIILGAYLWKRFSVRPLIIEYFYRKTGIHSIMKMMSALPTPNLATGASPYKKKRAERVLGEVIKSLKHKENWMLYPAGKLRLSALEILPRNSYLNEILKQAPETNIVLVRTTGLWGSSFSRALTGKISPFGATLIQGIKHLFKNLIFFSPRRNLTIEFLANPPDFPYHGDPSEINLYLETWYNTHSLTRKGHGEDLLRISHSLWKKSAPTTSHPKTLIDEQKVPLSKIPEEVQTAVIAHIAKLSKRPESKITPEMRLNTDLGMDSLDLAELSVFLDSHYGILGIQPIELTTVHQVMELASGQYVMSDEEDEEEATTNLTRWAENPFRVPPHIPRGSSIQEVFLRTCDHLGCAAACGDKTSGILSYDELKVRVILLARYFQGIPEKRLGILLPASVGAYILVLACLLAKKTPVMLNWTVGVKHLETVKELTGIKTVLTSWTFLDKAQNLDIGSVEEILLDLSEVRQKLSFVDKIRAASLAKRSPEEILKAFDCLHTDRHSPAVLLFTSGTEGVPKGVPLSHHNILSNQRACVQVAGLAATDVMLGMLPPFHSFGFSITGLLPLLTGLKVVYAANPLNASALVNTIHKWNVTVLCLAPTFLQGILRAGTPKQLESVRLIVCGAERLPAALVEKAALLCPKATIIEGYGITECGPSLTLNHPGKPLKGVGRPLPGVSIQIVDPETHVKLHTGEMGMIIAHGPNIFHDYFQGHCHDDKKNHEPRAHFVEKEGKHWYITGDLGTLDHEGHLTITGRLKRFVKIGGEMVSLGAIEETLEKVAIRKGWVTKEHHERHNGNILAVCAHEEEGAKSQIVLFACFNATLDELNAVLREEGLPAFAKISSTTHVKIIPLTGIGKTNYRQLEGKDK